MIYSGCVTLSRVLKAVLVLLVLVTAAMLYPPLRLSALLLAGRSPACPLSEAVKSETNQRRQIELKDEILHASTMIGKDDRFEQWQTPMGTYWIATGSRYTLPFNLAEQKRQIYGEGPQFIRNGDI